MRLGIDIGGTTVKGGIIGEDMEWKHEFVIPTPAEPEDAIRQIKKELVMQAFSSHAGVLAPGPLDTKEGKVLDPPNLPGWHGFPLRAELEQALGVKVTVDNDANGAAVGELLHGAARGVSSMVYITVSTGIGAGIIIGNRLIQGAHGNAGEIGNMIIGDDSRLTVPTMNRGSFETKASGTAMNHWLRQSGSFQDMKALTDAWRKQDTRASESMELWLMDLAKGLANVIHVLNPERIVLGGGTITGDDVVEEVRKRTDDLMYGSMVGETGIVRSELGVKAGIIGACYLDEMEAVR